MLEVGDRFVLRETGRRETVAGGVVLDVEPPPNPGPDPELRLAAREAAPREGLPALLVAERGAVRADDVPILTGMPGSDIDSARLVGAWWVSEAVLGAAATAVRETLAAFHTEHPLAEGANLALVRSSVADALRRTAVRFHRTLIDALLDDLVRRAEIARDGSTVRLATHRVTFVGREEEVDRLVRAIADAEPTPPTAGDLVAAGFSREVLEAAARVGALVRVSPDFMMTPGFVELAERIVRETGTAGITVSAFRERLGTSRKYALPLLEHFDRCGLTRRRGDLRVPRDAS